MTETTASLIFLGSVSFILVLALTPLAILAGRRLKLVDRPNARKVHHQPIPVVGGAAIVVAVLLPAVFLSLHWAWSGHLAGPQLKTLLTVCGCGFFLFALGFVDDIVHVPARWKLLALTACALAVCSSGGYVPGLYQEHVSDPLYAFGWLSWAFTMLWLIGVTVSVNFLDGMDGLASGVVALAAGVLAMALLAAGALPEAVIPIALALALLGFLGFNWHPARIFMGDGGSMFIGFMLAASCVFAAPEIGTMKGMVIPAFALSVPLLDTATTLVRRVFLERRSIFAAERGHVHHRLLDLGLSHRQVVLTIYAVSVGAVGIGWMSVWAKGWATLGGLSLLAPLLFGFMHLIGSLRARDIITAVRKKRSIDRERDRYRSAFEDLQLRFRAARGFRAWWQTVCRAAEKLGFTELSLATTSRDGADQVFRWRPADAPPAATPTVQAEVPIAQRRTDQQPLLARVTLDASESLESAGDRLSLFTRLMSDHSVARITDPEPPHDQDDDGPAVRERSAIAKLFIRRPPPAPDRSFEATPACESQAGRVKDLRVAVVHDFLYTYAGAERVLEQIINLYPNCDVFSLFDVLEPGQRGFLRGKHATTTFLQRLPRVQRLHRLYLPLMPLAIEQLDLSGYDMVISSSHLAAKGVITGPEQLHVCYCHSPVRYAWDLQHEYLNQSTLGYGPRGIAARMILHYIRNWDVRAANGVDVFVANSDFVARRIHKVYRRSATTIYPPVNVGAFEIQAEHNDCYVVASRLVPYKRVDLVIEAFNRMPDRELRVIGDGPEAKRLRAMAADNVKLLGYQPDHRLAAELKSARAMVFAAEEDFGILPVEAMACGTPVIAFGRGGARETIIDNVTGRFFHERTPDAIARAIHEFEQEAGTHWDRERIRQHAERFDASAFRKAFADLLEARWAEMQEERASQPAVVASIKGPRSEPTPTQVPTTPAVVPVATD